MNITVGRYNADSEDLKLLLEYSKNNKYTTLLNVATPGGMWASVKEICINDEDRKHLIKLRKEYKNILRNLWDPFDRNREAVIGCNTINRLIYTCWGCASLSMFISKLVMFLNPVKRNIRERIQSQIL